MEESNTYLLSSLYEGVLIIMTSYLTSAHASHVLLLTGMLIKLQHSYNVASQFANCAVSSCMIDETIALECWWGIVLLRYIAGFPAIAHST